MQRAQAFVCMHIALQISCNWPSLHQLVSGFWKSNGSVFLGFFWFSLVWFELLLRSSRLAKLGQFMAFLERQSAHSLLWPIVPVTVCSEEQPRLCDGSVLWLQRTQVFNYLVGVGILSQFCFYIPSQYFLNWCSRDLSEAWFIIMGITHW